MNKLLVSLGLTVWESASALQGSPDNTLYLEPPRNTFATASSPVRFVTRSRLWWGNWESATPLADLRNLCSGMARLYDGKPYGAANARLLAGRMALGHLIMNRNPSDWGGIKSLRGDDWGTLEEMNEEFGKRGLPPFRILPSGDQFGKWLPEGVVVLAISHPNGFSWGHLLGNVAKSCAVLVC